MADVAVIIPAAGRSARFGGPVKKPFQILAGQPIWQRAVELFCYRADVRTVFLVVAPETFDEFRATHGLRLEMVFGNVEIVAGGAERSDSVAEALKRIPHDVEFVAVHDAARPLTRPTLIEAVFTQARQSGAAILALPVADTLKRVDGANTITQTVPREGLWQAQTPQVFRRDWLVAAHARHTGPVTDDAQMLEAAGHAVSLVLGSPRNFKITTADDLAVAEALLAPPREPDKPALRPFADEEF